MKRDDCFRAKATSVGMAALKAQSRLASLRDTNGWFQQEPPLTSTTLNVLNWIDCSRERTPDRVTFLPFLGTLATVRFPPKARLVDRSAMGGGIQCFVQPDKVAGLDRTAGERFAANLGQGARHFEHFGVCYAVIAANGPVVISCSQG